MYRTTAVLGYEVFSGNLTEIPLTVEKVLLNTMSPNSYGIAKHDKEFECALKGTDVLVLDGIGVALGSLILNGKNIKKIAGQDCFDYFMELANNQKWKVFFLGSTNETLSKIKNNVTRDFPSITMDYYSPPYASIFSEEQNEQMIQAINKFTPDILFIGLTAPKQEKWAYQNKNLVNARIISTIGNVFDWYAGNSKRPAKIWVDLRLEWLVRIFLRPEIFRRNTKNQLSFMKDVLFKKLNFQKTN